MFGMQRFVTVVLLIVAISIAMSNNLDQSNIFSRILNNAKLQLSAKSQLQSDTTKLSSKAGDLTSYASHSNEKGRGWGWKPDDNTPSGSGWGGNDYVYSHSSYGKGLDLNMIIGGLSLLGLLGVALYGYSRPGTTVVVVNATGRRRRAADDLDDEVMEDGETMYEFLSRLADYVQSTWEVNPSSKKVQLTKLY